MPIEGITDKVDRRNRSMRIGVLHKGAEKQPNAPGRELPYFRFDAKGNTELQAAFTKLYGPEPTEIPCFLPDEIPLKNFSQWCEIWHGPMLVHRCTGKNVVLWQEQVKMPSGKMSAIYRTGSKPCDPREHIRKGNEDGDPLGDKVGRLEVVLAYRHPSGQYIPAFWELGIMGTVTLQTGGFNDIDQILGELEKRQSTREIDMATGEVLYDRPIPFILRRVKNKRSYDDNGTRKTTSKIDAFLYVAEDYRKDKFAALWAGVSIANTLPAGSNTGAAHLPPGKPAAAQPKAQPPKQQSQAHQPPPPDDVIEGEYVVPDFEAPKAADEMGKKLWPGGKWGEVRGKLVKDPAFKDEADMVRFTTKRAAEIADRAKLSDHISKGWPINGSGDWAVEMLREFNVSVDTFSLNPDPLNVIAGAVAAWTRKQQEGGDKLSAADLANIVFANACPPD